MRDLISTGGRLALICAVAALCLGVVNAITAPAIERVKERQLAEALEAVSQGSEVGAWTPVDGRPVVSGYYPFTDRDGYVVRLIGTGYGGEMDILASFDSDGRVLAATLLENQETPGLGKQAERREYMEKFTGTGGAEPVPTSKDQLPQEEADAISGATITFLGIAEALETGSAFADSLGGDS